MLTHSSSSAQHTHTHSDGSLLHLQPPTASGLQPLKGPLSLLCLPPCFPSRYNSVPEASFTFKKMTASQTGQGGNRSLVPKNSLASDSFVSINKMCACSFRVGLELEGQGDGVFGGLMEEGVLCLSGPAQENS